MAFPTPIFSEHPNLLIGVLRPFFKSIFAQIGQVMLKARIKIYSRDSHTAEFHETRAFRQFFFGNELLDRTS